MYYEDKHAQYLIVVFVFSVITVFCLSSILWLIFSVLRNRKHSLLVIGVSLGIQVLLYMGIKPQSAYHFFRDINIVNVLNINELMRTYNNFQILDYVFSKQEMFLIVLSIIGVISLVDTVLVQGCMYPEKQKGVLAKITDRLSQMYQAVFCNMPIMYKELHKLIFTGKGLVTVGVMLVFTLYFVGYGPIEYSDLALEKDAIYNGYGGSDYAKIAEMIAVAEGERAWLD